MIEMVELWLWLLGLGLGLLTLWGCQGNCVRSCGRLLSAYRGSQSRN